MNINMPPHGPTPTPTCATFRSLLPLAAHALLDAETAASVREHVAACAFCQSEMAVHDRVDAALRRSLTTHAGEKPPFSQEDILRLLTQAPDRSTSHRPDVTPARRAARSRRILAGIPAVAAVVLIALFAQYVFSLGRGHRDSKPIARPVPANIDIKSIAMVSPAEGWAVGSTTPPAVNHGCWTPRPGVNFVDPVILHFVDGRWSVFPDPPELAAGTVSVALRSISMISAAEGWAVGNSVLPSTPDCVVDGYTSGWLLHYTGGRWVVANKSLGYEADSIFMRSASDGWIVGQSSGSQGALVLHYGGSAWTQVSNSAFASLSLNTISAVSATDVWLAGIDYGASATGGNGSDANAPSVILHYDGHTWARQSIPSPHVRLQSLAMVSASDGWAVGIALGSVSRSGAGTVTMPDKALILHYHDGLWEEQSRFAGPAGPYVSVAMVSTGEGWAVGTAGMIVHYTSGRWVRVPSPTSQDLRSITMVSPAEGWAAGAKGTILHYVAGVWSIYAG